MPSIKSAGLINSYRSETKQLSPSFEPLIKLRALPLPLDPLPCDVAGLSLDYLKGVQ